jgi:DNA polymerase-3 subunit gamma/tau
MSYLALARRYRPADFAGIQSQSHITTTLQNAIKSGRISHAFLFCGPRGTGKTTTARVLAKALNCAKGPAPEPCGECLSCREITRGSSPDVFEIDAASNRGIDDIRELRENVRYTPVAGRYKIYIIDEVHRLTKEAFDALLKTLEEPPSHVIFIFATTDPQALPATILSRTQRYDFKRIPVTSLADAVRAVAVKEGLSIEPQAALLVAKKADGSFRDALSLLDQLSGNADSAITAEQAAEILGLVKNELLANVVGAILGRRIKEALDTAGDYIKSGGDSQELADALTGYIRTLMLIKSGIDNLELLELDAVQFDKAKDTVADADIVDLLRYFTILADYKSAVKQGQDPVFALEATLVKMAALDRAVSLEALLQKLPEAIGGKSSMGGQAGAKEGGARGGNVASSGKREYPSRTEPGAESGNKSAALIPTASIGNSREEASELKATINGPLTYDAVRANWDGFCESIKKSKRMVFGYLGLCKPSGLDSNMLTLIMENSNTFQLQQLLKPDIKRFLEDSLKDYYGSEIRLILALGMSAGQGPNSPVTDSDSARLLEGTPGARELFDSLGGEIIGQ